ncbi:unnamed protein product [Calicophoron daubneyi]|uniref:Phosphodiesterase n=1 Tax=Calicophoron daubneyi TaxID=300641 RepID=A0AAV2TP76_CALDB
MALKETIKEFDWCLDVLENLQCKRSVSSLTRAKFCSILSQELSSSFSLTDTPVDLTSEEAMEADTDNSDVPVLTDPPKTQHNRPYLSKRLITHQTTQSGRSSSQISDYIYLTFIEEDDDDEVVSFSDSHESRQLLSSKFSLRTRKGNRTELGESENGLPDENGDVTRKKVLGLRSGTNEKSRTCVDRYLMELWESNAEFDPKRVEQERGILESMSVPVVKMFRFLQRAESLYSQKNSFHNAVHATDVLHTTDVILTFNNVEALFSDLEIFATLFACVIHDIDHPGVSNQYLINANSELAILYNDNSVLENHHLSFAFELLAREPQCDVTSELTTEQRKFFRKMVINLVLSTDMSKHMSLLADLKTMVETQRASGSNIISLDNYSSRIQILQSLIHAADLSNPTKPLRIYRQWVDRITQEMFRQGDLEREAGLEISPMCDRKNAQVNENQVSFIDYIIYPLWETLGELLSPDSKIIMHNITQNREWYAKPKNEQGQEEN